jgi:nitrogen fixation NifU-like protein
MYDLRELYQEVVMDHNRRPRNSKKLEDPDRQAEGFNPLCGDQLTLYLALEDDLITDVAVEARGCAISTASASMMTESIKGKSIEEAKKIFETFRGMVTRAPGEEFDGGSLGDLEVLAGVSEYPARIKCATLSWHTLQSALLENQKVASTE